MNPILVSKRMDQIMPTAAMEQTTGRKKMDLAALLKRLDVYKRQVIMSRLPQISEAEYEVMKVIWNKAPISTNEVTDCLSEATEWSPKTIQTLLKRLVQKGAITYEKKSRVFVYTPLVAKEDYLSKELSLIHI